MFESSFTPIDGRLDHLHLIRHLNRFQYQANIGLGCLKDLLTTLKQQIQRSLNSN